MIPLSKNISRNGPQNCRSLGYPGFPVELGGACELHAPFLTERRTRGIVLCCVAGNPGSLGMTKGRATLPWRVVAGLKAFFINLGGQQAHASSTLRLMRMSQEQSRFVPLVKTLIWTSLLPHRVKYDSFVTQRGISCVSQPALTSSAAPYWARLA
jgi:hypothetical protein